MCLVSKEFSPFQGWGAGTYASLMAQALAGAGHEVHVLTCAGRAQTEGPSLRPGVRFHAVTLDRFPTNLPAFAAEPQRWAWGVLQRLLELHAQHPFDYIEFPDFLGEGAYALRAQRTLGALGGAVLGLRLHMTIRHIRSLNRDDWFDLERMTVEQLEDWAQRHAPVLCAPSRAVLEHVERRDGPRLRAKVRRAVPLPFPLEQQRRELGYGTSAAAPARPTILFAGRFEWRKGPHVLVDAFQRLREQGVDADLRLVGEDTATAPLRRSMRGWIEQSVLRPAHAPFVRFEARCPRSGLGQLFAQASVVCVPSTWDNFPFACLEAMACGAYVVGTDAGGMPEVIEDGISGLIARADDPGDLARVLRRALEDAPLRQRCQQAAPARVAQVCDPARVVRAMEDMVDEARRTGAGAQAPASTPAHVAAPARPRVAIIVPVFDTPAPMVEQCLASVISQGERGWECWVVDDASTRADTIALLDRWQASSPDPRVRVLRRPAPHRGPSAARNLALSQLDTPWVLPLDSDDMLEPFALEHLLLASDRCPDAVFLTGCLRSYVHSPEQPVGGWIPMAGDAALVGVINAASSNVALIRTEALRAIGGYDEHLPAYEDWDVYVGLMGWAAERAARRGGVGIARFDGAGELLPEFLVLHRLRPDSLMHRLTKRDHHLLRARILAKHAGVFAQLGDQTERAIRAMLGDSVCIDPPPVRGPEPTPDELVAAERRAQELIHTNIRYRVADRLNDAAKRLRVHSVLKRALGKGRQP